MFQGAKIMFTARATVGYTKHKPDAIIPWVLNDNTYNNSMYQQQVLCLKRPNSKTWIHTSFFQIRPSIPNALTQAVTGQVDYCLLLMMRCGDYVSAELGL
jgi:hypothetical protein